MRMTVPAFIRNARALARVLNHIGSHLDDELSLAELAELACLSTSAFERLYLARVHESPMATVRRLRLQRAAVQLRDGRANLLNVALDAGYASHAAFTRAFVRQFGMPPSRYIEQTGSASAARSLRLEWMPPTPVLAAPYRGLRREIDEAAREVWARSELAGAEQARFWRLLDGDRPFEVPADQRVDSACLIHAENIELLQPAGLDRMLLSGGWCAVLSLRGMQPWPSLRTLREAIVRELQVDWDPDRRILYREVQVSACRAPQDRHVEFWLPLKER